MHEFSLIIDLMRKIKDIAAQHQAKKVASVRVVLGALCHISPEHFREHFEEAAVATVADGAELEVVINPDPNDPHAQDILLDSVDVEE
ncbi:MAG: hydrogenase maturation nickel metallochaperone HypA [Verrucomicrobiales bacterium]|nr:hydrogenase maturation nickel metallochaperone HypA [Verrucomicrobiales bacterium]